MLLTHDDLVELVQQIFVEAGLDFQISESLLNGVGLIHLKYLVVARNGQTESTLSHVKFAKFAIKYSNKLFKFS